MFVGDGEQPAELGEAMGMFRSCRLLQPCKANMVLEEITHGVLKHLNEEKIGTTASLREQLELHRKNSICASCHVRMDPLGFGLENFDAVGAWRTKDGEFPINASGTLPDGRSFTGPQGLKSILKAQPDTFTESLTRKMLMYALGRGLETSDDGAVKEIVREVAADNYRMSSLILGIVNSRPFQKRRGESSR